MLQLQVVVARNLLRRGAAAIVIQRTHA
jgi:hypothetical protein